MLTRDTDIEILSRVKFQYRIEMSLHVVTVSSPHGSPSFYSFISIKHVREIQTWSSPAAAGR